MSQKSRHRKWANSVGDLNTCTENPDIMSKKCKKSYDPRPYGFGCRGVGGKVHVEFFVHYSKLQNDEMTTFTNISIASLVHHR